VLNITTIFYATVSVNGCTTLQRTAVTVTVNQTPTIISTTDDLICSGTATLNANASEGQVLWFDSLTSTTPIFIGNPFETPVLTVSTTYYVLADNSNCESLSRTPVHAIVDDTVPEFDLFQDTYALCVGSGSIDLETINAQGKYSYIWKKEGEIIGGNFSINTITSSGMYSVSAVSEAGCESQEKTINVRDSEIAKLTKEDVLIIEDENNISLQITNLNLGIGDYEFALDDEFGTYQTQGIFNNLSTGMHTLFIKDKLGCGTQQYQFSVVSYPKFFTPNGDGENDVWKLEGYDKNFYTISNIYIYNRFGKLIHTIERGSEGWDGNYQSSILPSNDFWFRVVLSDINGFSEEKTGNFSLIRK
jgi:gliding motility-associated-like protein